MRILHISTRLIVGGSQENTLLSCRAAADAGHSVALAFGPIYGPEGSLLPRLLGDPRIERFEVRDLVRDASLLRDLACARQLRSLIREWKPDVVHTHSSKAGVVGRAAAWRERVGVIVHTVHGLPFHRFENRLRNAIYVCAERWAARRCHAIVSVADAMTVQALARGVGIPSQYVTIRSGMEVEPFLAEPTRREEIRARYGWEPDTLVLGTIARLAENKGHDDLIDALSDRLLSAQRPRIALFWVGDGWWRKRLVARLNARGIDALVALSGLVDPSEIPALVGAMDVIVHPSYREGLPRAVVQGLLAGKPVIAYDIDGAREVCVPNHTGILVKPGDIGGIRNAVAWMAANPDARRTMGEHGRAALRAEFDWRTMSQRLLALYRSLGAP
ncbi:MAG: glycosyltransferase family 1 protein [Phycisphaerales bacterium]|nr:glycosyltransferase family 1 protein [Phycisphaerales bacterium]